jgi:hypothetical protein
LRDIECERRSHYRKIRSALSPHLEELEVKHDEIDEKYREARKEFNDKCNNHPEFREKYVTKEERSKSPEAQKVRELKAIRKGLRTLIKEEREKIRLEYFAKGDEEFKKRKNSMILECAKQKDPRIACRPEGISDEDFDQMVKKAKRGVGGHTKKHFPLMILNDMLQEEWPEAWKEKAKYDQIAREAVTKARDECGCHAGTYLLTEEAANDSFRKSSFDPKPPTLEQVKLIGIQTKSISVKTAFKGTSKFRLKFCPDVRIRGYSKAKNYNKRNRRAKTPPTGWIATLLFGARRKGSSVKECRIDIPFIMHRKMPKDGIIKWVILKTEKVGTLAKYSLQFKVESETFNKRPVGTGVVAVKQGWRKLEDCSLQTAVIDDGRNSESFALSPTMRAEDQRASLLQSYADKHFDTALKVVLKWVEDKENLKIAQRATDEWHKKRNRKEPKKLKNVLPKLKSHTKLAILTFALCEKFTTQEEVRTLWAAWKKERKAKGLDLFRQGSEDNFATIVKWLQAKGIQDATKRLALYLEWWRIKDKHLVDIAAGIRRHLRLQREDTYRKKAINKARRYEICVTPEIDKAELAENPDPEDDTRNQQQKNANSLRQLCGVSVFEKALEHAFGKARFVRIPIAEIPTEHYGCGGTINVKEGQRQGTCSECEKHLDYDANFARQLWATYRERLDSSEKVGTARKSKKPKKVTAFIERSAFFLRRGKK